MTFSDLKLKTKVFIMVTFLKSYSGVCFDSWPSVTEEKPDADTKLLNIDEMISEESAKI